jgi:very-short-patch-repair endonuclease
MTLFAAVCKAAGLPVPVAEFRFHPTRRWRFDFAWPGEMVALEIDGGTWTGGRHVRGRGVANDCEKLCEAVALGWRVLRCTPEMVNDGRALAWLGRALKE